MPLSYVQAAGNGVLTTFSFSFDYLLKSHVKVYLGYDILDDTYASELVDGVGFTWTGAKQIQTTVAPANGQALTIIRKTPSSSRLVDWQDGGKLTADDLDTADLQNLYVVQEQQDKVNASSLLSMTTADAVSGVLLYQAVSNVAGIPASPANGDRIEVFNSTGVESFTPLTGAPSGFIGSSQIIVRLSYTTTGNTWTWIDYRVPDPDARYVKNASISNSTTSTSQTNVASSLAVKTAKDQADTGVANAATAQATANAALPKAGGTMTGAITFNAGQAFPVSGVQSATTSQVGVVQLSDSTSTTSSTLAATPTAVKAVKDPLDTLANGLVGAVLPFATSTVPTGWLKCNGDTVPNGSGTVQGKTANFAALYAVLGSTYGAAGKLPDLRGEFVRGHIDDRAGFEVGRTLGSAQGDDYKQHSHTISTTTGLTGSWNAYSFQAGGGQGIVSSSTSNNNQVQGGTTADKNFNAFSINANHSHTAGDSPTTGGAETRPRNVALLYCIKY